MRAILALSLQLRCQRLTGSIAWPAAARAVSSASISPCDHRTDDSLWLWPDRVLGRMRPKWLVCKRLQGSFIRRSRGSAFAASKGDERTTAGAFDAISAQHRSVTSTGLVEEDVGAREEREEPRSIAFGEERRCARDDGVPGDE